MTAWPMAWGDIHSVLDGADVNELSAPVAAAYSRVRAAAREELNDDLPLIDFSAAAGSNSRVIRSFEYAPRGGRRKSWASFPGSAIGLRSIFAAPTPAIRWTGTISGRTAATSGWHSATGMVSAGWLERWWGPGRDSSMILSTNARPMPSIGLQRIGSLQSESKWFRWIGPWTLTTFMGHLDDDRHVEDALLWGAARQLSARPGPRNRHLAHGAMVRGTAGPAI